MVKLNSLKFVPEIILNRREQEQGTGEGKKLFFCSLFFVLDELLTPDSVTPIDWTNVPIASSVPFGGENNPSSLLMPVVPLDYPGLL